MKRLVEPFQRFASSEAAGGVALLIRTAFAPAWEKSPWQPRYDSLLHHSLLEPELFDSAERGVPLARCIAPSMGWLMLRSLTTQR